MKLKYTLSYDGEYSRVTIPELDGKSIISCMDETYEDEDYLDIEHFFFTANFNPYDSDVFTEIEIQKEGGNDQSARATSYYEQLTREEADGIIGDIICTTLGMKDFKLETDSNDLIEENEFFEDDIDDDEIESDIDDLLNKAEDDFSEVTEYLEGYEDLYSKDIYDYAFREAIRQGKTAYVEEYAVDFDLDDSEGCSTYINETEDKEIIQILLDKGAHKSDDDYLEYIFSMASANGLIINFDYDFQQTVFEKYLKTFGFTREEIIELMESGEEYEADDFDRDFTADMNALGVIVENGEISFEDMNYEEVGFDTKDVLEVLGWVCTFEGTSWRFQKEGFFYIDCPH